MKVSEGVELLRKGDYAEAGRYYAAIAERDPQKAAAWLGLAAACFGNGDQERCITHLLKAAALDTALPFGDMLNEAKPGQPGKMLAVAERIFAYDTNGVAQATLSIVSECMASPAISKSAWARADQLKSKARLRADDPNLYAAMSAKARRGSGGGSFVRTLLMLLLVAGIGYGGWYAYKFVQTSRYVKMGRLSFVEARRLETTGTSKLAATEGINEPAELYVRALDAYEQSLTYDPKNFEADYMIAKAADEIDKRVRSGKMKKPLPPETVSHAANAGRSARDAMKKLDPNGAQAHTAQANLEALLADKTN